MRNLLRGRDNSQKHPDLSLHSYHYVPQNHAIFDPLPYLLATITLSPTASWTKNSVQMKPEIHPVETTDFECVAYMHEKSNFFSENKIGRLLTNHFAYLNYTYESLMKGLR